MTFKYRKINQENYNKMSELLSQADWSFINSLDIDDTCLHFHETITSVIDVLSPEISLIIPANKVRRELWYTKGLMKSSKTLSTCNSIGRKETIHRHTNPVLIM